MTIVTPEQPRTLVKSADDMDDKTFARHFTMRHPESLAGQKELVPNPRVIPIYRTFHRRLHLIQQEQISHDHE